MSPADFALAMALLLVAGVLVVWWLVRGKVLPDRLGPRDVGILLVAGLLGVLVQITLTTERTHNTWHVLSVIYLDAVVALPLLGALLVVGHVVAVRRDRSGSFPPRLQPPVLVLALLALVPAAVGWYATHVEPYELRAEHVELPDPGLPEGGGVRIGVLADLQTESVGGYERRAVAELVARKPDIVVVPGDLFQADDATFEANRSALVDLLASIDAPGGVYLVEGDTDGGPHHGRLRGLAEASGATYLHDAVATTTVGDRPVAVVGAHLHSGAKQDRVTSLLAGVQPGTFRLLLAHRPDWALHVRPEGVDLVVAGHTHGGQVQVPWFGPLLTHSNVPRRVAAGGLHDVGGVPLYVSTGVGHEQQGAPQIRFLARPSIGLIDLVPPVD